MTLPDTNTEAGSQKPGSNAIACASMPRVRLNQSLSPGVKLLMVHPYLQVLVCAALLAGCTPHSKPEANSTPEPAQPEADFREVYRAAGNMASVVNELQATSGHGDSRAEKSGSLWIEVNRLRREGQNVRSIEWYASELEGSLRRDEQDAVARRHILNNLSYEVENLKRRQR
jgi:hypothetical protein